MDIFRKDNKHHKSYKIQPVADADGKLPRRIVVDFIDHVEQRYDTVGDYFDSGQLGEIIVRISKMKDQRFEMMVLIHELIEMTLCRDAGISNEEIDRFDFNYTGDDEPGNDPECPYGPQHRFATFIEHEMCRLMGIDWNEYNDYIDSVGQSAAATNGVSGDISRAPGETKE